MKKDYDLSYRLGMYSHILEKRKLDKVMTHLTRKSGANVIEIECDKSRRYDYAVSVNDAFEKGKIDIAFVDMEQLLGMARDGLDISENMHISGIMKRRDPRYAIIMKKKRNELISGATIFLKDERDEKRVRMIFDDINCRIEESISICFKRLQNDLCDALFLPIDEVVALGKHRVAGLRYNLLGCRECVPRHGQGVYAVLTNNNPEMIDLALDMSDEETSVCFDVEETILNRVMDSEYISHCDVYASINKKMLSVSVCVFKETGNYKLFASDILENKNLVIRNIVDRIKESM